MVLAMPPVNAHASRFRLAAPGDIRLTNAFGSGNAWITISPKKSTAGCHPDGSSARSSQWRSMASSQTRPMPRITSSAMASDQGSTVP
jgi:hypothetical protein